MGSAAPGARQRFYDLLQLNARFQADRIVPCPRTEGVKAVSEGGLELPPPAPVRVLVGNYCHVMSSSDGLVHEEQSRPPNP